MYHKPVLLTESINLLVTNPGGVYVDVTFGGGGHSAEILRHLNSEGRLIAFDQDSDAIMNEIDDKRFTLINQNFRFLKNFLRLYNSIPVDGILADLGISSYQIDNPERGFSFRFDSELDLRMNKKQSVTAKTVLNSYTENQLFELFKNYGEIANAKKLSRVIIEARSSKEITTTSQLLEIISSCVIDKRQENKYSAKVFQALRIEVNQEIEALKEMLVQSVDCLKKGGRIAVISYHSLEDRLVKNFFRSGNFDGIQQKDFYGNVNTPFILVNRKPIFPCETEINENNRSRSAKLRIAEKK
jgi:16S rRNA (cytosine1402-N4)-methyltransferase